MQHSPTEVKKRLDKAVDPDGNVMDLVAVLEIVSILEKLPLTKEALEKTRIGRTINLLRKKTENAELAKRAKKLVKKWQTLVVSHLEALRIADSPLNGQQSLSPQVNGLLPNDGERPHSAGPDKCKLLEGNRKRKREKECSSSEGSPVLFSKNLDEIKRKGDVDRSSTLPFPRSKKLAIGTSLSKGNSVSSEKTSDQSIQNKEASNSAVDNIPFVRESSSDASDGKIITRNSDICDASTGDTKNTDSIKTCEDNDNPKDFVINSECVNTKDVDSGNSIQQAFSSSSHNKINGTDSTQLCSNLCDGNSSTTSPLENDLLMSQDSNAYSQEIPQKMEPARKEPLVPMEKILDMSAEATGITGRYGQDGQWYTWTDVMPYQDGSLNILPYVILD